MKNKELINTIVGGGVGVLPTDTIFGFSCGIHQKTAVDKIYALKQRPQNKPFVILIAAEQQLSGLGVRLDNRSLQLIRGLWEETPTSIILPTQSSSLDHIHGGAKTLAVRLPSSKPQLIELIANTGPLVSTSVNISGTPALGILSDIQRQFPHLDFYIDGDVGAQPSRLMKLESSGNIVAVAR